ncbi:MAG TPA: LapA family protein [Roseiarcus sp.]|nr:LapA family protein [Roseiarcus sp.]
MIRFLKLAFFVLVAVVLLGFAFANRHDVIVSFDPFASRESAALAVAAPLFAVVIAAAMLGVVAGAVATWLSQGRHRRASRQNRLEADKWRAEAQALKAAHPREAPHPALPRG